jgi:hypothetical protein
MKLRCFLAFLVLAVVCITGCRSKPALDVVNGRPMVSGTMGDIQPTLDALAKMPASEQNAFLHRTHPDLAQRIVYFLRARGKIRPTQQVDIVRFFFGSLDKVKGEDATGKVNEGFFKNQLVARVGIIGQRAPIDVVVRCLNGIFELPEDLLRVGMTGLGGQLPIERFTIGHNDNLVNHVGYRTAIDLAELHGLPIFRGKGKDRRAITPAEARRLESETDRIQVAALVYEGDSFDLVAGSREKKPPTSKPPAKRAKNRRLR